VGRVSLGLEGKRGGHTVREERRRMGQQEIINS